MSRLKGWATNSAKQPSILRAVCSLKNPHFSWGTRRTRVRLTTRDKLASVRRSALMGEYYVRRAYQRTVARHISIFR